MACRITGSVVIPDGSSAANRMIVFRRQSFTLASLNNSAVLPEEIVVYTDATGQIDVELLEGAYTGYYVSPDVGRLPFRLQVPNSATANFASLIVATTVTSDPDLTKLVLDAMTMIENGGGGSGGSAELMGPVKVLVTDTTSGLALTSNNEYFVVVNGTTSIGYKNSNGTAVLIQNDMERDGPVIPQQAPTPAALVNSANGRKSKNVPLKQIMGSNYTEGTNGSATLNAAFPVLFSNLLCVVDPDAMRITLNSGVFWVHNWNFDLTGTKFIRNFSSNIATFGMLAGGWTAADHIQNIRWNGGEVTTSSNTMFGHAVIGGFDNAMFTNMEITEFYSNGTTISGHGLRFGGDNNTVYGVKVWTECTLTGNAGIRILYGDSNRVINFEIKSGDDACQFVPVTSTATDPLWGLGCTNSYFLDGVAHSHSKMCIAAIQSSLSAEVGFFGPIFNCGFRNIVGSYGQRAFYVANDAGLSTFRDQVDHIYFDNCQSVRMEGHSGVSNQTAHIQGTWDKAIGLVTMSNCHIDGRRTSYGLDIEAPGCRVDASENNYFSGVISAGRLRSANAYVKIGGEFVNADDGVGNTTKNSVFQTAAGSDGSTILVSDNTIFRGVYSSKVGLSVTPNIKVVLGDIEVYKASGATSTTAISAASATIRVQYAGLLTDCDTLTTGSASFTRRDNSLLKSGSYTISGGVVSGIESYNLLLDTEASATTDDLDTVTVPTWANPGDIFTLRTTNNGRDVVVKNGTGNIRTASGSDVTLGLTTDRVSLVWDGVNLRQIGTVSVGGGSSSLLPKGVLAVTDSTNKSLDVTTLAEHVTLSGDLTRHAVWTINTTNAVNGDTFTVYNDQNANFTLTLQIPGPIALAILAKRGEWVTLSYSATYWQVVRKGQVAEAQLSGLVPPLSLEPTQFLNGLGQWATPAGGGGGGPTAWGTITGTLSSQTDLQDALDGKSNTGHTHSFAEITSKPTTLSGYGITDAASATHTHTFASITSKPTTLSGYGITDAALATHTHSFAEITSKPTTLAGYGITDGLTATVASATYQPLDSDLTALAGLTGTNTLYYRSGSGVWSPVTIGSGVTFTGGVLSASGGGSSLDEIAFLLPDSGELIGTATTASNGNLPNAAGVVDQVRMYPYTARATMDISALVCRCGTGATGGLAKLVVYSSDALGRPDSLLFESGDLDFSAAGFREAAWTFTLQKGTTYWLGIRTNSTANYWGCGNGSSPHINGGAGTVQTARVSITRTVTYSSPAPSTWTWSSGEITNSTPPHIWLRRA